MTIHLTTLKLLLKNIQKNIQISYPFFQILIIALLTMAFPFNSSGKDKKVIDFNYPQDVSKAALSDLDKALDVVKKRTHSAEYGGHERRSSDQRFKGKAEVCA